jgi:signal transduction histidine kinase
MLELVDAEAIPRGMLFACGDGRIPCDADALVASLGLGLVRAQSASEAIARAGEQGFVLIVIELATGRDGLDTAQRLRACPSNRETPIVVVVGADATHADAMRCGELGAVELWPSPLMAEVLAAKLRAVLAAHAHLVELRAQHDHTARRLAAAIRLRDDFLSIAGHELRTPLATLSLHLELLEQLDCMATSNGRALAGKLARDVERLTALIDDLLDVSRLAEDRFVVERSWVDLGATVRRIVEQLGDDYPGELVQLDVAPVTGRWDRRRIEQMVRNLVSNALKYSDHQPVVVRLGRSGDGAVLEVADRGIGIAVRDQARVFDRFERADSSNRRSGLGLGLWIAKQVVDAHGGTITLSSELGVGSTFTVRLPLHLEGSPPGARASPGRSA